MAEVPHRVLERYAMYEGFASGGMAVVHYGRVRGAVGFSRPVAIKKLHPHFAQDPSFVAMFLDEARLASRVQHPNVVQTIDAVSSQGELFVVLEYVHGTSLSALLEAARKADERMPPAVASAILFGVLEGLHAAHEARDAQGELLEMVHRDVSPQNVLVGTDGVARVLDFGVAKARGRTQVTRDGAVRGKLAYMAPEQISGRASRASDVFGAAVVLWEALTGQRLFVADDEAGVLGKVLYEPIPSPLEHVPDLPAALAAVVVRGLEREVDARFASARAMAEALRESCTLAAPAEVGAWVKRLGGPGLDERAARIAGIEQAPASERMLPDAPPPSVRGSNDAGLRPSNDPDATMPEASLVGVEAAPARKGRSRRWAIALVPILAIGAIAAVVRAKSPPVIHDPAPSSRPLAVQRDPAPSSMPPVDQPDPVAPSLADGVPSAAASARGSAPGTPPAPSLRWVAPHPRPAPSVKKPSCSPAYTVDERGLRHYKPECL